METENKQKNTQKFRGFSSPNYTPIPDEILDELMFTLSGAELKVLLYICRRTFGFKKMSDDISLNQICNGIQKKTGEVLDSGTGLSQRQVIRALKTLIDENVVHAKRNTSLGRGFEPTTYTLNFLTSQNNVPPFRQNVRRGVSEMSEALVTKSKIQETVIQEKDNNVNVSKERGGETSREEPKTDLHRLPNLGEPPEKTDYIASEILAVLGDANSKPFYRLVAAKIPESFIRQKLSELKQGNAHSPARVFVSIVKRYAAEKLAGQKIQGIAVAKEGL